MSPVNKTVFSALFFLVAPIWSLWYFHSYHLNKLLKVNHSQHKWNHINLLLFCNRKVYWMQQLHWDEFLSCQIPTAQQWFNICENKFANIIQTSKENEQIGQKCCESVDGMDLLQCLDLMFGDGEFFESNRYERVVNEWALISQHIQQKRMHNRTYPIELPIFVCTNQLCCSIVLRTVPSMKIFVKQNFRQDFLQSRLFE